MRDGQVIRSLGQKWEIIVKFPLTTHLILHYHVVEQAVECTMQFVHIAKGSFLYILKSVMVD